MKYFCHRHKSLMRASEFALEAAAHAEPSSKSRIATTVLGDSRTYRFWESSHAAMMQPVSRHLSDRGLLIDLRRSQIGLVHGRALFRYLDNHDVRGHKRRQVLRMIHSTLDYEDAVLFEHRRFMLSVSSRISSHHIARLMDDNASNNLIRRYEEAYDQYFALKCDMALARTNSRQSMLRPFLTDAYSRLKRLRRRIETEKPSVHGHRFEVQEALSRSGRYEALNYLNA